MRSHIFSSSGQAYNDSQCCDVIHDGDVLLVPSEGRVAVLVEAWPTLVGTGDPGEAFHTLTPGYTFREFRNGHYLNSAVVGIALLTAEGMKDAGLGINEPLLNIAREHGWSGEIPSQERYMIDRDDSYGAG